MSDYSDDDFVDEEEINPQEGRIPQQEPSCSDNSRSSSPASSDSRRTSYSSHEEEEEAIVHTETKTAPTKTAVMVGALPPPQPSTVDDVDEGSYSGDPFESSQSSNPSPQTQKPQATVTREPSHIRRPYQCDGGSRGCGSDTATNDVEFIVGKAPKKTQSVAYRRGGDSTVGSSRPSDLQLRRRSKERQLSESFSPILSPLSTPRHNAQDAKSPRSGGQRSTSVSTIAESPSVKRTESKLRVVPADSPQDSCDPSPSASTKERKDRNKRAAKPSMPQQTTDAHRSKPAVIAAPVPDPVPRQKTRPARDAHHHIPHNLIHQQEPQHGGRISKELQKMIQARDQLRREVADMSVALEGGDFGNWKEGNVRARFFEIIEAENHDLAAAVQGLKVGCTSLVTLSDKLALLSREISCREKELKSIQREVRKVTQEIKCLTRTAGGDDQTAIHDEFVKKKEELIAEVDAARLRHHKQIEELSLSLEHVVQAMEQKDEQIVEVGHEVHEQHVSTMEHHEYVALQKSSDVNRKRLSQLKQALAGLEYQYEPPAQVVEWQEKRVEIAHAEHEQRLHHILKQIKHREATIMANYAITERPSHFVDPADATSMPSIGCFIVPPPLPTPPPPKVKPQVAAVKDDKNGALPSKKPAESRLSPRKPPPKEQRGNLHSDKNDNKQPPAPKSSALADAPERTKIPPPPPAGVVRQRNNTGAAAPAVSAAGKRGVPVSRNPPKKMVQTPPQQASVEVAPAPVSSSPTTSADGYEDEFVSDVDDHGAAHPSAVADGETENSREPRDASSPVDYAAENVVEEDLPEAYPRDEGHSSTSYVNDGGATTEPSQTGSNSHSAAKPEQVPVEEEVEEEIPPWLVD